MREKIINFLKSHRAVLNASWSILQFTLSTASRFIPKKKKIVIASYAGRKYDDSPKALYDEICKRHEFDEWDIIWVFVDPNQYKILRGKKVRVDTFSFFYALLSSMVWISNTGMDRDIHIKQPKTIKIETWHGTPLKKIGIDQNNTAVGRRARCIDSQTIRCAQSEYDRNIFKRVFNATEESFLLVDLPRNDELRNATFEKRVQARRTLEIPEGKKAILYMPTYREYDTDEDNNYYAAPPIDIEKWRAQLGDEYVLLIRAHYAVSKMLGVKDDEFVRNVTDYPTLNDLYIASDVLISDYSSSFIDYSILGRPILCFAYDYEKYAKERGLYIDFDVEMPSGILRTQDEVLNYLHAMDYDNEAAKTAVFRNKYAPFRGNSRAAVVDELINRINSR